MADVVAAVLPRFPANEADTGNARPGQPCEPPMSGEIQGQNNKAVLPSIPTQQTTPNTPSTALKQIVEPSNSPKIMLASRIIVNHPPEKFHSSNAEVPMPLVPLTQPPLCQSGWMNWTTFGILGFICLLIISISQPINIPAAGQFLFDPSGFFSSINIMTIISSGLLLVVAYLFRQKVVSPFCPSCTNVTFVTGITGTMVLSVVAVLIIQVIAQIYAETLSDLWNFAPKEHQSLFSLLRIIGREEHGKSGAFIIVIGALLFLVGGGYAYCAVDASLFTHILSFTVGVGLLEEVSKALVGVAFSDFC